MTLGVFVNALALTCLVAGQRRWIAAGLAVAWTISMGTSLYQMNRPAELRSLLAYHRVMADKQAACIGRLMETRDAAVLTTDEAVRSRFPHFQFAVDLLLDPRMRPFLAPSLTADGRAGPLSRWAPKIASCWPIMMVTGLVLLALGTARFRVGPPPSRGANAPTAA